MKLGLHTIGDPNLDALRRVRGPVAKVYDWDSPETIREIGRIVPLVVYRHVYNVAPDVEVKYNNETPDGFFARLPRKLFGLGLIWEGPNEPILDSGTDAKLLNSWYLRFAKLMHDAGERVAAFSFSTGNPNLDYVPSLIGAAEVCDYIALHEYYSFEATDRMFGRYREFMKALGLRKSTLITECGFDNGGDPADGWRGKIDKRDYIRILRHYAETLEADSYVVGATIFNIGGGKWGSFDVAPMLNELEALSRETITPAPGPTPQPPSPQPVPAIAPEILDLIRGFEGLRLTRYPDAGGWAIGYGHTLQPYEGYMTITKEFAEELLESDVSRFVTYTKNLVKVAVTPKQFAALVSFCYNAGSGSLQKSELLRLLNAGNYHGAALVWLHQNVIPRGQTEPSAALLKRREKESDLFASDIKGGNVADPQAPSGEEIVHEQLKIAVRRATGAHWHAKEIEVTDSTNMDVNIYVNAFRDDKPAFGSVAMFWWPYWKQEGWTTQPLEDKNGVPRTDFPMSGDSTYSPERNERGPYGVRMANWPSDEVIGIGLPLKRHIKVRIVFEWVSGETATPPSGDLAAKVAALADRVYVLESWQELMEERRQNIIADLQ